MGYEVSFLVLVGQKILGNLGYHHNVVERSFHLDNRLCEIVAVFLEKVRSCYLDMTTQGQEGSIAVQVVMTCDSTFFVDDCGQIVVVGGLAACGSYTLAMSRP